MARNVTFVITADVPIDPSISSSLTISGCEMGELLCNTTSECDFVCIIDQSAEMISVAVESGAVSNRLEQTSAYTEPYILYTSMLKHEQTSV